MPVQLLWLVPVLPLAGFITLVVVGGRMGRAGIARIGAGSVGLAAIVAIAIAFDFVASVPPRSGYQWIAWTWMNIGGFEPAIGFYLDALSLVMMLVVTVVSFVIHLYSTESMLEEEGYRRFFAYMNLFVASMCVLVLADNLLFLYMGWEGVGLCSYLLIGFWYKDAANGLAARKAFVVTRVGDAAMWIGLLLLFTHQGTLDIQPLMQGTAQQWVPGSGLAIAAAWLLLAGAVGKSAQLPLQTWLPDAMAGPTPVSALIHAATMVTAGVYLIARTHVLYALAPSVQLAVAVVGALTLLLAGFSALVQRDIKRVLAYSTISQIGYMFLALGVGAWSAAIFHLMTHAFFKALLFLSAGVVISSLHDEHDIFRMGGLRTRLPLAFWTFLIGSASLAALPLITAGFYSKDLILSSAWSSMQGSGWLWLAGWVGALLTGIYIFRVVFVAFLGEPRTPVAARPGWRVALPLVVLAVLSIAGGWIERPDGLGELHLFTDFLRSVLPQAPLADTATASAPILEWLAVGASIGGILIAFLLYRPSASIRQRWDEQGVPTTGLRAFLRGGWGFDTIYDRVFVRPYLWLARIDKHDFIDSIFTGAAHSCAYLYRALSATQDGRLRHYAAVIVGGAIIVVFIAVAA